MLPALIGAGVQGLMGLGQTLFSGRKAKERELEQMASQSPMYKGSKSVEDYYNEAVGRYKESPYQSQQYQEAQKAAGRTTAAGLGAMQDRRSALGAVGRLAGIQNQAMANAGMAAEQQRNQRFGQLGGATQMKTAEDYKKFDINEMSPYQRKLQLAQYRAQAANSRANAGLQMLGGAASNLTSLGLSGAFGKSSKINNSISDYSIPTISPEKITPESTINKMMSINPNAKPLNFSSTPKYLQSPIISNNFSTNEGKNWWEQ